ncbi:MAG: ATP-grasp domain-containing protein [Pseudomonadota bacterium]
MMLLEHDAKTLLGENGIPSPPGVLVDSADSIGAAALPPGPWMVKAQVAIGGRGKAGAIGAADTLAQAAEQVAALVGTKVRGRPVRGCRIEQRVMGMRECYISFCVDPASMGVRVLMSEQGGIDIEKIAEQGGGIRSALANDRESLREVVRTLSDGAAPALRRALAEAGQALAEIVWKLEATLLEVNPLFIRDDGSWVAGDAKLVIDDNALGRQPALESYFLERRLVYPEVALKIEEGFDYVLLDTDGQIGLVTTGAGLSMALIDQITAAGCRPFNFVDIRSGQFRGDPRRLVQVLRWIARGPQIRVVLVNIFAGITHLGEFSRLLVEALRLVPELRVPIVARLVGNGQAEAESILSASGVAIAIETDLDRAVALALLHVPEVRRGRDA